MQTVNQLNTLRDQVSALRADGPVALVPTMGALHEGHLTLVKTALQHAAHVVVSIFVNPIQFGPNEDLDRYPRQLAQDAALLTEAGASLLWAPSVETMYPAGFATNIGVTGISDTLCGASRPGHFDGVCTVVAKLFNQVRPDLAFFGEKDWQQLTIIRQMARDLDFTQPAAVAIHGVPTVREPDGLALSSRNAYLTLEQRSQAVSLPNAMRSAIAALRCGVPVATAMHQLQAEILASGFSSVDYAELVSADSLTAINTLSDAPARLIVAARIGATRLIDNMEV